MEHKDKISESSQAEHLLKKKTSSGSFLNTPADNHLTQRRYSDAGSILNEDITYTRHASAENEQQDSIKISYEGSKKAKKRIEKPIRKQSKGLSKEKRVTMTLFAISILYIIANLPSTFIDCLMWYQQIDPDKNWKYISDIEKFSYLLYLVYFDLNPFIYFASNSFYRAQVIAMFHDPLSFLWVTAAYNQQQNGALAGGLGPRRSRPNWQKTAAEIDQYFGDKKHSLCVVL